MSIRRHRSRFVSTADHVAMLVATWFTAWVVEPKRRQSEKKCQHAVVVLGGGSVDGEQLLEEP